MKKRILLNPVNPVKKLRSQRGLAFCSGEVQFSWDCPRYIYENKNLLFNPVRCSFSYGVIRGYQQTAKDFGNCFNLSINCIFPNKPSNNRSSSYEMDANSVP